jgi:hypothetical protein
MPFFDQHNLSILFVDSCYVWDYRKATTSPSLTKFGQKWPLRCHLGYPRQSLAGVVFISGRLTWFEAWVPGQSPMKLNR